VSIDEESESKFERSSCPSELGSIMVMGKKSFKLGILKNLYILISFVCFFQNFYIASSCVDV